MENKKKALGKGLEQLFANNVIDFDSFEKEVVTENKNDVTMIKLADIRSNPYQPRKHFDEDSLKELAASIKEYGIIQPVIVKKSIKGYELVAGERRCKASKLAGLTEVPAVIKEYSDQEMRELALIENIQREDLNAIDEAKSVMDIIKLRGFTQEEFGSKFGKSRSYVTNLLGLLSLPDEVQKMIINKQISSSHGRVLSKLDDKQQMIDYANLVISHKLNVRDLEEMLNKKDIEKRKPINRARNPKLVIYEKAISDKVGNRVKVANNKVEIYYNTIKDLERIMEILDITVGEE